MTVAHDRSAIAGTDRPKPNARTYLDEQLSLTSATGSGANYG